MGFLRITLQINTKKSQKAITTEESIITATTAETVTTRMGHITKRIRTEVTLLIKEGILNAEMTIDA